MNGISRQASSLLHAEKIKMLEQYYPQKLLQNSELPYIQSFFGKNTR